MFGTQSPIIIYSPSTPRGTPTTPVLKVSGVPNLCTFVFVFADVFSCVRVVVVPLLISFIDSVLST